MKKITLLLLIIFCANSLFAQSKTKPNIVLIMADDLGWRDLGVMGSQYYETPAIDQLAAEGLLFTDAYSAAPVCAPTRAALMTGKSPARLNQTAVFDRDRGEMPLVPPQWVHHLPLDEITIAERLKEHGYTTAIMGKWHLGVEEELWPENQGFDVNVGAWKSGKPKSYFPPYENPRLPDGPEDEYMTDRLASEAVNFIEKNADAPFFLYFPTYNPHSPIEAPEATIARFKDKKPDGEQDNPAYAAMIAHLDMAVGSITQALKDSGVEENTLIIFTSDNGGVKTIWDLEITDNSPLRAEKFLLYEGGIRVPLIVKWPGKTPKGEKTSQMAITTDLVPTIMSAIGEPIFEPYLDGTDLTPVYENGESAKFPRMLAWHYPHYMPRQEMKPSSAIRMGSYKLLHWHESHDIELYNLDEDLGEKNNLAQEMPDKTLEMYDRLQEWRNEVGAQMPRPNPQYTISN
jgi:arylsulfatase A-like enzyme